MIWCKLFVSMLAAEDYCLTLSCFLTQFNFSWSIDLSEDANILAVGGSLENPQPTDESIRMYQWDGKRYTALLNGVPGGTATSLSLSSEGRAVAVGLPFGSSNKGSTRVYSFHPSSPCEDPYKMPLRISFTTDGRPEETSWKLQVDSQVRLNSGSGSLAGYMYTTFVEEMCIPETSCVKFIVYDTQGDGVSSRLKLKITLLAFATFFAHKPFHLERS